VLLQAGEPAGEKAMLRVSDAGLEQTFVLRQVNIPNQL
jgi:hypothetical protein